MKTCSTCLYWLPEGDLEADPFERSGLCRRNPPTPVFVPAVWQPDGTLVRHENVMSVFPSMTSSGWCGAHTELVGA